MSDESVPYGSQPANPEPSPVAATPDPDPSVPAGSSRDDAPPVSERERADSITPMSSPIVSIGDDTVRADRSATIGSDPPAPSVRRLVPPPKPKGYDSKPPQEGANLRSFPPPAALPIASAVPSVGSMRTPAVPRVASPQRNTLPSAPEAQDAGRGSKPPPALKVPPAVPSVSSTPPAQRGAGSLPPNVAFPSARGPSLSPPTLPSGANAPRYPWLSNATMELAAGGEPTQRETAGSEQIDASRAGREPTAAPREPSSPQLEPSSPQLEPSSPQLEPSSPPREPVLPPARRSDNPASSDPSTSRAAVLPRATRDPMRRSSTPPPKPRIVPPRPAKETPTVAIQAMRIIAIGSSDPVKPSPAESETSSPEAARPEFASRPESSTPDGTRDYTGELLAGVTSLDDEHNPLLPPNDLDDANGLELYSDDAAPPVPVEARRELSSVIPPAPNEPQGLELYQLPSRESTRDDASDDAGDREEAPTLPPLTPEPSASLEATYRTAPSPTTGETGTEAERSPDSVEFLDDVTPSARKPPPPPRRNSMPSAPSDGQLQAAASVPPERPRAEPAPFAASVSIEAGPRQVPPAQTIPNGLAEAPPRPSRPSPQTTTNGSAEAPPRQPPPAPSRVPREPPVRPDRAKDSAPASSMAESDAPERPKTRPRRPWWEELFGEDFSRATTRLSDAQIEQEVSFIEESLGVAPGGAVLDLGCGAGLHAVELAARGYGIVGYDLSLHQLALAQEVAQERGQKLNFLQGDMREMAFEEVFDGMYCWNTTFGYFEEEKNFLVAQRMFAALKPGGTLLLDVANRDFVAMDQPSSVWYEGDSAVCMDDMCVDFFTSRLRVKRSLILDDGRTRECHYSIRLYSLHELGKLLHEIGFRVTEASGHPATPGVFLGQSSPRIIILAQKP